MPDENLVRDAQRYRWLRDGNAYFPEEEGITGGEELDAAIDERMEEDAEEERLKRIRAGLPLIAGRPARMAEDASGTDGPRGNATAGERLA